VHGPAAVGSAAVELLIATIHIVCYQLTTMDCKGPPVVLETAPSPGGDFALLDLVVLHA
jgi:hypothetical protein